jgi:nucleoid-associated protein YgaU
VGHGCSGGRTGRQPPHESEITVGRIASSIRFVVGLAMVTAGVIMAVPFGRLVADAWTTAAATDSRPAVPGESPAAFSPVPADLAPPVAAAVPGQVDWTAPEASAAAPVALRTDYAPPVPPDRLPPVTEALMALGPNMNGTYRSTLDVPPPALLDAHAPPPLAASWAVAEPPRTSVPAPAPAAVVGQDEVPASYVIRDGDDLTGIAARFYGHPGAAASVWSANRDLIPDPNLLPIGVALRLPPPWSVRGLPPAAAGAGGRSIEPPVAGVAPHPAPAGTAASVPAAPGWLGVSQAVSVSPAAQRPSARGSTVRLGPGETLQSIAEKFYGDRSAAQRIWEANRDRLRSPDLAVVGMELRLP